MPSTITSSDFTTFVPKTKAKSNEVNSNFDIFRGTRLPVEENTSAASNLSHDLGSTSHRWNVTYLKEINFYGSTSTANLSIQADLSNTSGSLLIQIASSTVARIMSDGFHGGDISSTFPIDTTSSFGTNVLPKTVHNDYTSSSTLTLSTATTCIIECIGAGGAGGGGGAGAGGTGGAGGGGGASSQPIIYIYNGSSGDVLSIGVAPQATGGGGGAGASTGTAGGDGGDSFVLVNGATYVAYSKGGLGGSGGDPTGGNGGAGGTAYPGFGTSGGAGGAGTPAAGSNAQSSAGQYTSGLGGATGFSAGGGGGGGASTYGGGTGGASGGASASATPANRYGAGGGGGGGGPSAGGAGGSGGSSGQGRVRIHRVLSNPSH